MKYLLLLLTLPFILFSGNLDSEKVLDLAMSGNEKEISKIFNSASALSIPQGNSFLNNLALRVRENFGSELECHSFKEVLWDIIDSQEATEHQKFVVKKFFSQLLNDSFHAERSAPEKFTFLKSLNMMAAGATIPFPFWMKAEVADGIIIGAVETLAGALLFLTPFRAVGTGLMVDGVRRMLNAVDTEGPVSESSFEQ